MTVEGTNESPVMDLSGLFKSDSGAESEMAPQAEALEEQIVEPVVEPTVKEKKEDPAAARFAALARREKQLRSREKELESRLAELESKMNQAAPKEPEVREPSIEELLKRNPLDALKKYGWNFEKLTDLQLSEGKAIPQEIQLQLLKEEIDNKYNGEIKTLKEKLEAQERQKQEEKLNQQIESFKSQITSTIEGGDYPLTKANKATEVVYNLIEQHYDETGRILDIKEAADEVEKYLNDEFERLVAATGRYTKVSNQEPKKSPKPSTASPTLSNSLSATAAPQKSETKLSRDEAIAQAANLIKWSND